ncbi:UNVERIFIED_CONTAM: hypothetical protein NCL1_22824 [Trichonephila clavipes]
MPKGCNFAVLIGVPCDDPSRSPIARLAPMLFTSTTPSGFYNECELQDARSSSHSSPTLIFSQED